MAEQTTHTEVPGEAHAAPSIGGFITAPTVVAIAMALVIILLIWKKVPAAIGKSLDKKIDAIREQLAEAESLRKDAEALKAEYEAKAQAAGEEAQAMLARAKTDAEAIVAKAEVDAKALVETDAALSTSGQRCGNDVEAAIVKRTGKRTRPSYP